MRLSSLQRGFDRLVTDHLRLVLEERSIRSALLGVMLVGASWFSLLPDPGGIDPGWLFIAPVAVAAISAGLGEGLVVAFAAAVLGALYTVAAAGYFDPGAFWAVLAARFLPYGLTAAVMGAFAEAHHSVQSNLRHLASIDPLTKLANVTSFYERLRAETRGSSTLALLLVDVDGLKALNDRFGHQAGTEAIQAVAAVLRRVVRGTDCVARYGGDEFVVVLREADGNVARIVCERIRGMLVQERIDAAPGVALTVSIGVAVSDGSVGADDLLAAADRAMYRDKRARINGPV